MNYGVSEDYFDLEHLMKVVTQKVKIELCKEEMTKVYSKKSELKK